MIQSCKLNSFQTLIDSLLVQLDKEIKYWDGGQLEMIQKLVAHNGEVWCLAVMTLGINGILFS